MRYNRLNSDLVVSQLCLGTMTFGYPTASKDAIMLTHWAMDHGIIFFDTADIYQGYNRQQNSSGGVAESILGDALLGRRDKVIITTKVGNRVGGNYQGKGLNKHHILNQIDSSLSRLRTDVIDIYEMHLPDQETKLKESISVFADLIKIGKIRFWGFSNFPTETINEIIKICDAHNWPYPVVSQPHLSWLNREANEEHNKTCLRNKIALTPYRVLEGGLLTGKYKQGQIAPIGSRLSEKPTWMGSHKDETFKLIHKFEEEAKQMNLTPSQYAIKWVLERPNIASVIIGAKNSSQIEPFLNI